MRLATLLFASLLTLPALARAETVTLDCRGWLPLYLGNWEAANPQEGASDAAQIVVNTARHTISAQAALGRVVAPLHATRTRYFGRKPLNAVVYGRRVLRADVSVNRVTGEGFVSYILAEEGGEALRVGFQGICEPVRRKF
ncbi:MAG TPA: hypothetical protein VGN52_18790 [Burkholderiales bacterium]